MIGRPGGSREPQLNNDLRRPAWRERKRGQMEIPEVTPEFQEQQQAFMAELDFVPGQVEDTNPEKSEVEVAAEPELETQAPEVKEPSPEPAQETQPETESKAEPTATELLATYKEQLKHFQKLYEEKQAELSEVKKVIPPPAQVQEPAQPVITQAQIRSHYEPEIQKAVEAGYLSETFSAEYPDEAAQFLYHRDIIYGLSKRLTEVVQYLNQNVQKDQVTQIDQKFNNLFDETAKHGGFYEPLTDPTTRENFKKYIIELNPYDSQLTPEFIAGQWLAYNREAILAAVPGGAAQPAPAPKKFAQGEGGSNRPGKVSKSKELKPWDDI